MPKKKIKDQSESSGQQSAAPHSTTQQESIIISPIENLEPELIRLISQAVQQVFGYRTEVMPLLQDVYFALDPDRNQHYSTLILDKLAAAAPEGAVKILAITREDLFIPILTHVYGEAQIGGKACIISTCRLEEGLGTKLSQSFQVRAVKESIHELGHTFNLRHCRDRTCIMHYCRSIKDVDQKADQFCRYCKILLVDEIKRIAQK